MKAVIEIQDDDNGQVDFVCKFDPKLTGSSAAHRLAVRIVEFVKSGDYEGEEDEL